MFDLGTGVFSRRVGPVAASVAAVAGESASPLLYLSGFLFTEYNQVESQERLTVSSFYHWAQKNASRADFILQNPVDAVRLKAPKAYQTKSAKALTDEELRVLVKTVKAKV